MPIENIRDLHQHLELAIRIELATVPPYLYAMYSIQDPSSDAALLLRSIVVEEMLHAALVTNLLLATGGEPDFESTRYMTTYPADIPHHIPPLRMDLAPCTQQTINTLMRLEQPEERNAPAQPDQFETLGQYYHALEQAIHVLSAERDLFEVTQPESQLSNPRFYTPVAMDAEDSGGLMLINDEKSALEALEIIVHQGEGLSDDRWADPDHKELTHYHKLVQIADGTTPIGNVWPLRDNPRVAEFPEELRIVGDLFNALYRATHLLMGRIFSDLSYQSKSVGVLYILMADVLSRLAHFLVTQELPDGHRASPTFEIFEFSGEDRFEEIMALAASAASIHVELTPLQETLTGIGFIL